MVGKKLLVLAKELVKSFFITMIAGTTLHESVKTQVMFNQKYGCYDEATMDAEMEEGAKEMEEPAMDEAMDAEMMEEGGEWINADTVKH